MTQEEVLRRTRQALDELERMPPEELWRQMIERGLINEKGEVLWNLEYARQVEEAERKNGSAGGNGAP